MKSLTEHINESKSNRSLEEKKLWMKLDQLFSEIESLLKDNDLEKELDRQSPGAAVYNSRWKNSSDRAKAMKLADEYDEVYYTLYPDEK